MRNKNKKHESKNTGISTSAAFTPQREHLCTWFIERTGKLCGILRLQGTQRCGKHSDFKKFPENQTPPADGATFADREVKTIEQIRDTYNWLINEFIQDRIRNEKAKTISELLKAQLAVLNELYKRSPEGQEKTLDQISKVVALARDMSIEGAARALLSDDFGKYIEQVSRLENTVEVQVEEQDAEVEQALLTLRQDSAATSGGGSETGDGDPQTIGGGA